VSQSSTTTLGVLPRSPEFYIRSPWQTLRKVRQWLAARFTLRSCDSVGPWTRVTGKMFIQNEGAIHIGERVQLLAHFGRSVLATFPGGVIEIGDRTIVNYGADICATKLVHIGADCMLGTHVIILDSDFHEIADHERVPESRPVHIGNGVWIGNRAMILPGITIGDGAVVGAGSVVMSDIPARTLAMGNPARVIKKF
jgi:acetyltransferase-like isoleucine patch superfamily enzyme